MATQSSVNDNIPWKERFFAIWGGQAFFILGSQLVQFALIWHLAVETRSATVPATASMIGTLTQVILGPLVGALLDTTGPVLPFLAADAPVRAATAQVGPQPQRKPQEAIRR